MYLSPGHVAGTTPGDKLPCMYQPQREVILKVYTLSVEASVSDHPREAETVRNELSAYGNV